MSIYEIHHPNGKIICHLNIIFLPFLSQRLWFPASVHIIHRLIDKHSQPLAHPCVRIQSSNVHITIHSCTHVSRRIAFPYEIIRRFVVIRTAGMLSQCLHTLQTYRIWIRPLRVRMRKCPMCMIPSDGYNQNVSHNDGSHRRWQRQSSRCSHPFEYLWMYTIYCNPCVCVCVVFRA